MTAPRTEAAIVAHGQPGDPGPLQAQIAALAGEVQALLPGWRVHGATLADPASLAPLRGVRLVYPLFMAEGWFTRSELPRRLREAGAEGFAVLRPLGLDPALVPVGQRLAQDAAGDPAATALVVAGHGSGKSRGSAEATRAFAAALTGFRSVEVAFLEEPPFLGDVRPQGRALCLPFFATAASHTTQDIPAAWPGPIAPAVGLAPEVPALIAAALRAAA